MAVNEVLLAQGEWSVQLSADTPDSVRKQLGLFGHVAVVRGDLDPADYGDALLAAARYVGILLKTHGEEDLTLTGSGMLRWLGDEDGKGKVLKTPVTLTNATLTQALTAVLPPAVPLGTVYPLTDPSLRYTNTHVFQSPREAVQIICDAFAVEYRVNNTGTLDVGRPDQLYNTTAPDTIIVRRGTGSDVDLTAIGGTYSTEQAGYDYTTEVLLLGQTIGTDGTPDELFATGSKAATVVPYKDIHGNQVELIRIISESGQTEGSADVRAQLQFNRFNRLTRALSVTAEQFEAGSLSGSGGSPFNVGDATWVHDPVTGVLDPTREVYFHGEVLHPDLIRITEVTWPVVRGHTVAYRAVNGTWTDLTRWVVWEGGDTGTDSLGTSGATELRVGDLPTSLTSPSGNQAVQDRVDAAGGDASIPKAPTGLTLASTPAQDNYGNQIAFLRASWAAVTQNTDNTPIVDLDHYEIRFRPQFRAPGWSGSALSDLLTVDAPVQPGLVYDVQVRAVDRAANASDWSGTASITAAVDSAPPPAPADPIVTSYLGQLRIEYSGVDAGGNPMPADTAAIEVYVGGSADFFPVVETKVADLSPFTRGVAYATAPYGTPRWVRLVAADGQGNRGPSSAAVQGTTTQVVSSDVFDGAIGSAKLADLAVISAKIADLAVNDAKIGNLSAGKIIGGEITADIGIAGRFTTALFGQRVEMNAVGFQGWNIFGQQTINLNGNDNLLVGRLSTGTSGSRYIEVGTVGDLSVINFLSPDSQRSFLRAYTDTSSTRLDAIQMGVQVPSYTTSDAFGWNVIGLTQQEAASYRTKTHDFLYQDRFSLIQGSNRASGTQTLRFQVDTIGMIARAGSSTDHYLAYSFFDGTLDLKYPSGGILRAQTGGGTASPTLQFINNGGQGFVLKFTENVGGSYLDVLNLGQNSWGAYRAAEFNLVSDARTKNEVSTYTGDAMAAVRDTRPVTFQRKGGATPRTELGLLAQEAPTMVVDGQGDTQSISLGQLTVLLLAALKQVDARLLALEPKGLTGK